MSYSKKKPYRHKGPATVPSMSKGSDASMVRKKNRRKSDSDSYKDHIDGA